MDVGTIMLQAHSGWRYLVILAAIIALSRLIFGWSRGTEWKPLDRGLGMVYIVALDIQFLIGAILWIVNILPVTIKNPTAAWEHPVTMLLSIAVAHISWSRARRSEVSSDKYRTATIGFVVSAIVLAVGIARITGTLGQ